MFRGYIPALLLATGINSLCAPAHAGLGGDAAAVLGDADGLQGKLNVIAGQRYDTDEITGAMGMRVCEYLTSEGIVFAVSWSGPVLPDLQRLLGAHFAAYSEALRSLDHPGLHRSVRVSASDLIVESGGHLRAYAGRAYVPSLVPAGVSPAELL